ncbi:hypothetical protein NIES22_44040 [Calothrix brevissima NIES-22]|nr:hypothetical protein NIES22_44040 [Calothrix brevissima NIES-22]
MTQERFSQDNCDADMKNLQIAPLEESSEETQIQYLENNENSLDTKVNLNLLGQWMKSIVPFLKPGGKTVAKILALGIVSIPLLMMSGSIWVATILAVGCTIVAIFK